MVSDEIVKGGKFRHEPNGGSSCASFRPSFCSLSHTHTYSHPLTLAPDSCTHPSTPRRELQARRTQCTLTSACCCTSSRRRLWLHFWTAQRPTSFSSCAGEFSAAQSTSPSSLASRVCPDRLREDGRVYVFVYVCVFVRVCIGDVFTPVLPFAPPPSPYLLNRQPGPKLP